MAFYCIMFKHRRFVFSEILLQEILGIQFYFLHLLTGQSKFTIIKIQNGEPLLPFVQTRCKHEKGEFSTWTSKAADPDDRLTYEMIHFNI